MRQFVISLILALLATLPAMAGGKLTIAPMFGTGAVLQRDVELPIWGTGEPGAQIQVSFDRKGGKASGKKWKSSCHCETYVENDGRWMVKLGPQPATDHIEKPTTLRIRQFGPSGRSSLAVKNILFGDVWICSGQSNMDMNYTWGLGRGKEDIETNRYERIRLFNDKDALSTTPLDNLTTNVAWSICDFEHAKTFSACGFFFGQALHQRLPDVPIGLIEASWNGSPIRTWMSAEAFQGVNDQFSDEYKAAMEKLASGGKLTCNVPAACYNAMIHPLFPMALKGAIWYQGCSDFNHIGLYGDLFRALASDWRSHFTHPDGFPIYLAQLAGTGETHQKPINTGWAEMRWEQMKIGESVPLCATAVLIDTGEKPDVHAKDKKTAGERLARLALVRTYGVKDLVEAGPVPLTVCHTQKLKPPKGVSETYAIRFKNADGLRTRDGKPLRGFQLTDGKNAEFVDAKIVTVDGQPTVQTVPAKLSFVPTALRYAWDEMPDANLVNGTGIPCGPFEFPLP
jgi:sialate O-acetylesterase